MLKINGINYNKLHAGCQVSDSLTGKLDSCVIILDTKEKPTFKIFDLAEFEGQEWLVSIVNPETRVDLTYRTNLTLIELTYALEKYVLSPCAFTNADDTLLDQIDKLFYKVEPIIDGAQSRFRLSARLTSFLTGKMGEDFVYGERMTLREILDDMISIYGIRATVSNLNNDWTSIEIDYIDLNRKSDDVKPLERMTAESEFQSAEYYADEFDVSLVNAQSREKNIITHDWQTLKPTQIGVADTENIRLVVDYPIEEVLKVEIKLEVNLTYRYDESNYNETTKSAVLSKDITELFIEQEIYDALDIIKQEDYIPYRRGSKEIGIDTYKALFFTINKLYEYLVVALVDEAKEWLEENQDDYVSLSRIGIPTDITSKLWKLIYAPQMNFRFKQTKQNKAVNKGITSVVNQTDRVVDIDKYGKVIKNIANMAGNKDLSVSVIANTKNDLLELGDRVVNDYTLIAREYNVFTNHIKANYTFSQFYEANVSARLSRERRLYNIPEENLIDRTILLKDKLLVSTNNLAGINTGLLNDDALKVIVLSFSNDLPENKSLDKLVFYTTYLDEEGQTVYLPGGIDMFYALNFTPTVIGNSIIWQAKTQDNYSVGLSSGKKQVGGREVHLNPYVNDLGEFNKLFFKFGRGNIDNLEFDKQLNLGKTLPVVNVNDYIQKSYTDLKEMLPRKDRLESLLFGYQLEVSATSDNIVIGDDFAKHIQLFKNAKFENLVIWTSENEVYNNTDTAKCKGEKQSTFFIAWDIENYEIEIMQIPLENVKSWAIGTEDGRLLIAVNNNNQSEINKIYFGIKRN